jgi:predicted ATPase
LEHLHTGVWSFLDEAQEHRITRLYMPKRVAYERGNEALARMEHLLRHPPCSRMPSMLLYGDSDIGKTMIVDKFVRASGHLQRTRRDRGEEDPSAANAVQAQ